jgi:hypothetical protein
MKRIWNYDQPAWINIVGILLAVIIALGFCFGVMCLSGWLIMLLWNATLPAIFSGVSAITFWQAFCLDLLLGFLTGGLGKIILSVIKD